MIAVAKSHCWCAACMVVFLGLVGWMIVAGGRAVLFSSTSVEVWCCLHRGEACAGKFDPAVCAANGAIAYSRKHDFCAAACGTPPPPNAIPTTR